VDWDSAILAVVLSTPFSSLEKNLEVGVQETYISSQYTVYRICVLLLTERQDRPEVNISPSSGVNWQVIVEANHMLCVFEFYYYVLWRASFLSALGNTKSNMIYS
jgi:hypothetical protein